MNALVNARRNDPCPCGSGIKFKNCHGNLAGGAEPGAAQQGSQASAPHAGDAAAAIDQALQRAMQSHQAGDLAGAEVAYRSILSKNPDAPIALHFLGVALWQRNEPVQALSYIEESLKREAGIGDFHNNHALVLKTLGRREDAIAACRRALSLQAGNLSALNTLGMLLVESGAPEEAIGCFEEALHIHAGFLEARVNLGQAFFQAGKHAQALAQAEQVLAAAPEQIDALLGKAHALQKLARFEEAVQTFDRILALRPADTRALNGKATALLDQGDIAGAEDSANKALAIDPGYGAAHITLGNAEYRKSRTHEALARYAQAEQLAARREPREDKALAEARTNVGIASLALGDWSRAWPAYAWKAQRPAADRDPRDAGLPPPLPRDLSGQTLVVRGEQGLGDVLFFLRFCRVLARQGAKVIYRGDRRLIPLLQRSQVFSQCIPDDQDGPAGARTVWAGDLPYLLGSPAAADCPPLELVPDTERQAAVRHRLHSLGAAPHIAVTWRAGTQSLIDNNPTLFKAVALEALASGLKDVPGTLISVQRHPKTGETEALARLLGREVHDWSSANDDLEEMLAIMALADDYIGVSNTNTHLRASLGKPAKVLVPRPAEWRWMAEGDRSPWFPGMLVLREDAEHGWQAAMNALHAN